MIVFSSATSARRAEQTLASAGIPTTVVRPPASVTGGSCSHAVKLDCRRLSAAERTLTARGVSHRGVYRTENGKTVKI